MISIYMSNLVSLKLQRLAFHGWSLGSVIHWAMTNQWEYLTLYSVKVLKQSYSWYLKSSLLKENFWVELNLTIQSSMKFFNTSNLTLNLPFRVLIHWWVKLTCKLNKLVLLKIRLLFRIYLNSTISFDGILKSNLKNHL